MRSLSTLLAVVAVLLCANAGTAAAQTREGFFLGLGGGWGSARIDCDDCGGSGDRQGSLTGHIRLGTTLSSRLAVGAELNGWLDSEQGDDVGLFNATAAFYLYPSDQGLFLKGGVGLSHAEFQLGGGDTGKTTLGGTGFGVMAGIGYDIPIGTTSALTPVATFWYGKPGDLKLSGAPILTGFKHNVIEIGVGITFY